MPSPFPGMDPYVESSGRWGDFHGSFAGAVREALNAQLPKRFAAEIELYVLIQDPNPLKRRRVEPDVYVTDAEDFAQSTAAAAPVAAPMTIVLPRVQRKTRKSVRIVDLELNRVVTAIELLSPSNKAAGDDRDAYLHKRNEYLASRVSLVEIDLLRGGKRLPLSSPRPDVGDYYVMVCRSWEYPRAGFWPFTIREPLPVVPIPLTSDVPDLVFPLRPSVDRAYDGGRYYDRLPYNRPLKPRVKGQDAPWVREILAQRSS